MRLFDSLKDDIPAGISVFLVAVPLCLGIAHASGAPLISGIISGIVGGTVVAAISRSALSVTGPAAGLTAIVLDGILDLGSFEAFLLALTMAGVLQVLFGILKVGSVASLIPVCVINAMLSAIGVLLIMNQFPQMIGYQVAGKGGDTGYFSTSFFANIIHPFVLLIGLLSLLLFIFWDRIMKQRNRLVPGALAVVLIGSGLAWLFQQLGVQFQPSSFVQIKGVGSVDEFLAITSFPQWLAVIDYKVYVVAVSIAVIASVETLLSIEAIDKLDPLKRKSPPNTELMAQGIGNTICGLIGGIPLTAVIVRGTVNVNAGGKTRISAIIHGLLLLVSIMFFTKALNLIPIAALAAILVFTGYKLFMAVYMKRLWQENKMEWLVFVVTIVGVVLTDLLVGVLIGMSLHWLLCGSAQQLAGKIKGKN
jgi:MFS superfamily sulfate permease-like transporter